MVPWPVLWARYSGFLVFFPLGVASELSLIYIALPYIRERKLYLVEMPNALNIANDPSLLAVVLMALYLWGFPWLYGYMLKQRRRALAPEKPAGKGAKAA